MEYSLTFEFECECGRKHKLRMTRDGMERTTSEVDRRAFYNTTRSAPFHIDLSPTIEPSKPGPDTIIGRD